MSQIVLLPIPLEEVMGRFTDIIRAEISATFKKQEGEKLLSTKAACELFNPAISRCTLYKWSKSGLVPRRYINGRIYYSNTDIMEAVKTLKKYRRDVL